MLEAQCHDKSYFLTLTYDNDHVPEKDYVDNETGELNKVKTLNYDDFQKFMKRLRKKYGLKGLKYLVAGEYGSNTKRPHYHCILFGLPIDDLVEVSKNWQNDKYYESEVITKLWKKGNVMIGEAT